MGEIWRFFEVQFLKMKWLSDGVEKLLSQLGIGIHDRIGSSIHFFIYDVIKIVILLSVLIFCISYIQSYFPPERTKKILSNFKGISANILSALLGTVTPFCSCSSIPLFIGFTNAGLPVGVTFSFLISSPMVDLGSFILLTSVFGVKIATVYVIVGLVLAVVGGTILDRLGMEKYIEPFVKNGGSVDIEVTELTRKERVVYSYEQVIWTLKKVFPYIVVGVGIGALIHNWIPEEIIQKIIGEDNPFSVLLAVIVGIPMYADIFGTIPIAEALGKLYGSGVFESYSAGTETKPQINQDAMRIIKERYRIDMEESQKSKLLFEIPKVDIVITMGCNVNCPYLPCEYREDWGLDDPSGKSDEEFHRVIDIIERKVKELRQRIINREI